MTEKWQTTIPILAALALFGVIYNHWVAQLENNGHDRGYMAFIVAAGVLVTLLGATFLVGVEVAVWTLLCFVASGLPMIAGSISRYCRARAEIETRIKSQCLETEEK